MTWPDRSCPPPIFYDRSTPLRPDDEVITVIQRLENLLQKFTFSRFCNYWPTDRTIAWMSVSNSIRQMQLKWRLSEISINICHFTILWRHCKCAQADGESCRILAILLIHFFFGAFSLFVGEQEGYQACTIRHKGNPRRFFFGLLTFGEPGITWTDLRKIDE